MGVEKRYMGSRARKFAVCFKIYENYIPIVFERKCDESKANSNKYDEKNSSDVLNGDAITLVFNLGTILSVELPPTGLEVFKESLVQELKDSEN